MAETRISPHNDDAEKSILGSLLIDKDAIATVSSMLLPIHFYNDLHGKIYEAMLDLYEDRKPIDLVTLTTKLKKAKVYDKIGGSAYLTDLASFVPTASNVEHYASIVKEQFTRRSLIQTGNKISELAYAPDGDLREILDRSESSLFSISQEHVRQGFLHIKDALAQSFDRIDELHKTGVGFRGVPTGFLDLDNRLSGMQDANLIILAARPGQGKTAMVGNIAAHVAFREKMPVGFFSLEMSKEELVDRLLVSQANIDSWKLKTGRLSEEDFTGLSEAMGELAEAPLFIDDTPGLSLMEMRTKARRLQLEHGLKLIIVDYLQLVDPGRRFENRVQEVSMVSQSLKNLARELKIPVLAVSQLSRAVEHRGEKRPQLADLRESGAIEQDADVVVFLYREEDELTDRMLTNIVIAKHRNGPLGEFQMLFDGAHVRFHPVEKHRTDEGIPEQLIV